MRRLSTIILAVCATLAASTAQAEPITVALLGTAFVAAHPIIAAVVTLAITTAASYGLGLLRRALAKKPDEAPRGINFEVQMGDDGPITVPVGAYATAGSRKYVGTWGNVGKTPNAYFVDVRQIADIPLPGQPGLWVNGEKCTVLWSDPPQAQGYPVEEFRKEGVDYLWVLYKDGTQTAADAYLLDKFGGHADRPWTADMIGRGAPHLIITARHNTELFSSGRMDYIFEPPVSRWYDIRKDTTAGGSGTQRWADPSTWQPTLNPAVIIYNIVRGIYYGDEWVFGGQNLPAFRLPAASWMAAANACDVPITLGTGGTEPAYRCGYEIRGDMEPLAVIEELEKASNGRVVELGGIFKMLVGAPGAAVYSITDGDILVSKGQSFRPFPGLEETNNGIEATYPEPAEKWGTKDAPARYSAALEVADGNRRLATSVSFPAVPFGNQVQRLMLAMIEDARRFRVHSFFLPPDAWFLEPNDVVSWSSARNGYSNKKFLVARITGERTRNQLVVLKEIDPSDYDWSTDFELPTSVSPVGPLRPPPQQIVVWSVEPAELLDNNGTSRRAAIRFGWDADIDAVQAVALEVRLAGSATVEWRGRTDNVEAGTAIVGPFLPDTNYEGRGRYIPTSNNRATEWTAWLPVKTNDIRFGSDDVYDGVINLNKLATDVQEMHQWIGGGFRDVRDRVDALATLAADQDLRNYDDKATLRTEIAAQSQSVTAKYTEAIVVATGPTSALGQRIETLEVQMPGKASAVALNTLVVQVNGSGGIASRLSSVEVALPGKASASAFDVLNAQVNNSGGIAERLTGVEVALPGKASAAAFDTLNAQVNNSGGIADRVSGVETLMGTNSANSTFRMAAGYTPGSGWTARIGMQVRVNSSGTYRTAGFFLDVTATQARAVFDVNQFIITDGSTANVAPFVFTGGVAYMENARIGTVIFNQLSSANGKLVMKGSGTLASIEVFA